MTAWWAAQITDDAAKYLQGLMDSHQPGRHGWCSGCNRMCVGGECAAYREARFGLAAAGRLEVKVAWEVRPDLGRWP